MTDDSTREIHVRRATAADLPSLGRLGALLVRQHYEFDRRRFLAPTTDTPGHYASFLGSQLDDPDVLLLVAEHDARVVGYAYVAFEGHDYQALRGPAALLHDLIVDPDYRGRGAGRALLSATLSLTSPRVPRVILYTAQRNEPAQRFFERMGFRRTMIEMTREADAPDPSDG
jgi:ribosomal protein S18 acetylase RimI-like enzyme